MSDGANDQLRALLQREYPVTIQPWKAMHIADTVVAAGWASPDQIAELTRQRDDARALAINAGAFTDELETYRRALHADGQLDTLAVLGGSTPLNQAIMEAAYEYLDECIDDARWIAIEAGAFL